MSRALARTAPAIAPAIAPPIAPPIAPIRAGLLWYPGVRCPDCFSQHWLIGRSTAECGSCGAPLIIASKKDCSS